MALLSFREDSYDGIMIMAESLPCDAEAFQKALISSLEIFKRRQKRGIWLKIPTAKAGLLPAAVANGFEFHHARPGYAMLTKWLPNVPSTIPESLLYNVGVGAFLVNEKQEVLLVQEASGVTKGKLFETRRVDQDIWKFPTGLVDAGEDITSAVEREVEEETGLKVSFDRVLCIRHSHGLMFGRSDLFFVCAVRLKGSSQVEKMQESELAAMRWFSVEEVERLPIFGEGIFEAVLRCCKAYLEGQYTGLSGTVLPNIFSQRSDLLLHEELRPERTH